ncbi:MAG: hypothetical protein CFH34_00325 [Alphaproteobacteria bacterium MarineAlpha9_Bin4]|nr:hypothetical protein [Pelagibacterales bacterium]PPR27291.1 MAG: hypothetical protein CFH34_00325 [Alphaproteobacteria bacterium MarineAlpha9_Bin4]|tara:strand:- start:2402 stop:3544 length:1143 start_codon:yes stop_codon:yes gene_type:complete
MKKIFTTALLVVFGAFVLTAAKAELSLSGYQEFYAVSVDQSTEAGLSASDHTSENRGGLSNGRFTRLIATATTTLDNGIAVTGVYTISKDNDSNGDSDTSTVAVDENSLSFSGGFGTISVGNIFSAGTMAHNRGTTLIPTAEPDNGATGLFIVAGGATGGYGAFDEAGYALDGMKLRYMSNVYEGFSLAVSYESCMEKNSGATSATSCDGGTATNYDDVIDTVASYNANFDGVDVSLTYGRVMGNTQIVAGAEYNDLDAQVYSVKLAAAGLTAIYKNHTYGDSGQLKSRTVDGDGEGSVYAVRYDMGNISLGFAHTETSFREGTNAADSTAETDTFGIGYNLGGGVMIEFAHGSKEETDGSDSIKDTEADATLAKLSFGF